MLTSLGGTADSGAPPWLKMWESKIGHAMSNRVNSNEISGWQIHMPRSVGVPLTPWNHLAGVGGLTELKPGAQYLGNQWLKVEKLELGNCAFRFVNCCGPQVLQNYFLCIWEERVGPWVINWRRYKSSVPSCFMSIGSQHLVNSVWGRVGQGCQSCPGVMGLDNNLVEHVREIYPEAAMQCLSITCCNHSQTC